LAVDDFGSAMDVLIAGNELELALLMGNATGAAPDERLYSRLAARSERLMMWRLGSHILMQLPSSDSLEHFIFRVPMSPADLSRIYEESRLQPPSTYVPSSSSSTLDAVRGYGLARMFDEAFKRVTDLAGVFEANPFVASQICMREVETAMSLPILLAAPEYRSFILAMSTWVGALQACRCGYWDVVEPLVKGACKTAGETRGLWRLSQSFMTFLLEVVPALKEPTADRVAAVASKIRVSKDVHGDEETLWQTFLAECAAGNVPDYIYTPAKQQLRVVPVSSVIPSATSKKLEIKDFFSGQVVRGQEEWLPVPLDSQTLAVSVSSAIMWASVCPFSPILDGKRWVPF